MAAVPNNLVEALAQQFPFGIDHANYLAVLERVRPQQPDRRLTRMLAQLTGKKRHQVIQDLYRHGTDTTEAGELTGKDPHASMQSRE